MIAAPPLAHTRTEPGRRTAQLAPPVDEVASTVLTFRDFRTSFLGDIWPCRVTIGMPIRHSLSGITSPEHAAELSANTALVASDQVMRTRPRWITALFCKAFADRMLEIFNKLKTGAKVTSP